MKLIKNEWEVLEIELPIAKEFVEQHHYAQGCGKVAHKCYGLYYKGDSNTLHGVSIWNPPAYGAAISVSSTHQSVLGLSRFCLVENRPENAGSFLISQGIKLLDKRWQTLLTYADTALNHDGGLYRAANWNYDKLTNKNPMFYDPINECLVSRKKGPKTYSKKEMLGMGYEFKGNFAKHRFIYPIQRKNIVVKPRKEEVKQLLLFTNNGKVKI